MKTTIEKAEAISKAMEGKKRSDETEFVCLKDDSPEWMKDVIRTVHGDKLPDDTTYRFIEMAIDAIADCGDEDEIEERLFELEPDVYTSDLTEWLHARNDHVYYLTEALEEYDLHDGFQALSVAQAKHIQEVAFDTLRAIEEMEVE